MVMKLWSVVVGASAVAAPAWGQPVTFADLQGATIEASVVHHQVRRRDGQVVSGETRQTWRTVIGPGDTIHSTSSNTAYGPRGSRSSAPRSGSFTLGKPRPVSDLGGGHAVWAFTNGTLNYLRTYRAAGGYKRTFSFTRSGAGLTCTIRTAFAREDGVGNIDFESPMGGRVEILSSKQVSSSCRVSK
jgi:hypothetical protein